MTTLLHRVRCDRKAQPWWESIPSEERAAIIAAIPEDCYLTVLHTNAVPPFSVRLLRTTPDPGVNVLVAVRRGYNIGIVATLILEGAA